MENVSACVCVVEVGSVEQSDEHILDGDNGGWDPLCTHTRAMEAVRYAQTDTHGSSSA